MKGRGNKTFLFTPTLTLPHQWGGERVAFSSFVGDETVM
jgi:hypothetical protein